MTVTVSHTFNCAITDDPGAQAAGEVLPSHWNATHTITGLGTAAGVNTGTSGATIPLLSTANTWSLAQTFSVAPVFTDASGTRTALGLGTAALAATGTSGATVPLLNGANTWSLAQTFTAAPVFTDQSGSRTALGLGTAATQNTGTSGATVPFLNGTNTWAAAQTLSAALTYGGVTLSNAVTGTGNMVLSASPTFTTQITHGTGPAILSSPTAAVTQLGAADVSSGAVAQTLQVQANTGNSGTSPLFTIKGADESGTGSTGGALTVAAGSSTGASGTRTGGALTLQSGAGASGTGALLLANGSTTVATVTGAQYFAMGDGNGGNARAVFDVGGNNAWTFLGNTNLAWAASTGGVSPATLVANRDTFLTRGGAAATLQIGAQNAASPVNQTFQAQGSRVGTDSNVGGATFTVAAGTGTGTGTLSSLVLQSPVAVASGTGAQTPTTGLTIKGGCAIRPSYTVANLPAAATVGAGAMAWVTDANATTFLGTVAGGGANKVPVSCDGTNWLIG